MSNRSYCLTCDAGIPVADSARANPLTMPSTQSVTSNEVSVSW